MATLVYSLRSSQKSHAIRAQIFAELFGKAHRVILLANGDAYQELYLSYQHNNQVSVRRRPPLDLANSEYHLNFRDSIIATFRNLYHGRAWKNYIAESLLRENAAIVVTDFEPIAANAARLVSVPFVILDQDDFWSAISSAKCSTKTRWKARLRSASNGNCWRHATETVVSSLHPHPALHNTALVKSIGPLIPDRTLAALPNDPNGSHILVHVKNSKFDILLRYLQLINHNVRVYGVGEKPTENNVQFCRYSDENFAKDLATCDCLITDSNRMRISEAFYLRKPTLAVSEEGCLQDMLGMQLCIASGCGWATTLPKLSLHLVQQFLLVVPYLRNKLEQRNFTSGNDELKRLIEERIGRTEVASVGSHKAVDPVVTNPFSVDGKKDELIRK